ncbi:hypothetical protein IFM89_021961 [Coptis chinensis]|uniref:Large ribosomal subunit protein uL6 N-terminal domain-containing protein n=1 Tax=Coptis chinensis TaxID=261450 RepID=A0A835HEW0_9MAGN|nr:hypothetical protein IFM89_021961 [Coptis chinensis]
MALKARVTSRNPDLIRGIGKYSRSKMYHKRGLWAIKAKNGGVFPRHDKKVEETKPTEKPPKFYPADDVKKPFVNKRKHQPTKLRPSITPGTVLIILAGRFQGKRVVFLNQLSSGLLLVTGSQKKMKKGEGEFLEADKEEKNVLPQEKKDDQKAVDALLIKSIEGVPELKTYLAARFSLKSGMKPHELVF